MSVPGRSHRSVGAGLNGAGAQGITVSSGGMNTRRHTSARGQASWGPADWALAIPSR